MKIVGFASSQDREPKYDELVTQEFTEWPIEMLDMFPHTYQEESKNVSDNIKWRYKRKFEQGEVAINATRFLGYDKDQYGDLVINRSQAEIVERIFNDCISGKGTFLIAKELTSEGVRTIAGGDWHSSTILTILRNEKYKDRKSVV